MQGPVVQPFSYDEAHPYSAGQHRGVDIGADAAGENVLAPASGTVTFAGTVAANGKSVTIETVDGYSVTLTHLGSISVSKGATVAEQDVVGTVGPSGTPEVDGPYVHLGIRITNDPNGYVDPLGLLPPAASDVATETDTTASQPAPKVVASTPPASRPAARPAPSRPRVARPEPVRSRVRVRRQEPAQKPRARVRATRAPQRPAVQDPVSAQTSLPQRPEVSAPIDLGGVHESRPIPAVAPRRVEPSSPLLTSVCNLAAVLFALGAALGASRQGANRRYAASTEILQLPQPEARPRQVSRAA